jgi:hypothetical protein
MHLGNASKGKDEDGANRVVLIRTLCTDNESAPNCHSSPHMTCCPYDCRKGERLVLGDRGVVEGIEAPEQNIRGIRPAWPGAYWHYPGDRPQLYCVTHRRPSDASCPPVMVKEASRGIPAPATHAHSYLPQLSSALEAAVPNL